MKSINIRTWIFPLFLLITVLCSCKKENFENRHAILQVFNALDNNTSLYTNLTHTRPGIFASARLLESKKYNIVNNLLLAGEFPQPVEFYFQTDTMSDHSPAINADLDLKKDSIYSLFIYGDKQVANWLLLEDRIPPINRKDSTTSIRFANFSSTDISVNLQGKSSGSFIQQLPFKSVSDFREIKLNLTTTPDYVFEIRNKATGTLILIYTINGMNTGGILNVREFVFRSVTLVITGQQDAATPNHPQVTIMQHR